MFGMAVSLRALYQAMQVRGCYRSIASRYPSFGIFTMFYMLFIVKYTYNYRYYPAMKDAFIMPPIPCTAYCMLLG